MGTYFKIIDKRRTDGRIDIVKAPPGSQILYDEIEDIAPGLLNPVNDIPFSLEVDGWGELACVGEIYETRDFVVECLSYEDYYDYTN